MVFLKAMNVSTATVKINAGGTFTIEDYSNIRPEISLSVSIPTGKMADVMEAAEELQKYCWGMVYEKIDDEREIRGRKVLYSDEPLYCLFMLKNPNQFFLVRDYWNIQGTALSGHVPSGCMHLRIDSLLDRAERLFPGDAAQINTLNELLAFDASGLPELHDYTYIISEGHLIFLEGNFRYYHQTSGIRKNWYDTYEKISACHDSSDHFIKKMDTIAEEKQLIQVNMCLESFEALHAIENELWGPIDETLAKEESQDRMIPGNEWLGDEEDREDDD